MIRRALLALLALGSIATLLGQLYALAPMSALFRFLFLPSVVGIALLWIQARRAGDRDLTLQARAGLVGGLWGTLGYDWVRVPLHAFGQNPFAPLRAYGVWLAGASQSSLGTDLLGVLYQFSNGITLGLIYALLALRRPWILAVAYALLLEALAVVGPFGQVFAIRYARGALVAAFAAHLFYGAPLGWTCRGALRGAGAGAGGVERSSVWTMASLTAAFLLWFLTAWQPPGAPRVPAGGIQVGPDALYPGWTDVAVGTTLHIESRMAESITLRWRHSSAPADSGRELNVPPLLGARLTLDRPGVYQILAPGRRWRSAFVSARRGNDYRDR